VKERSAAASCLARSQRRACPARAQPPSTHLYIIFTRIAHKALCCVLVPKVGNPTRKRLDGSTEASRAHYGAFGYYTLHDRAPASRWQLCIQHDR
jgi:hypothetical protein